MGDYCIVVASGLHARCFTLEPVELPELESGPKLVERGELFNPDKEMARRDLYTDSKTGRGRAPHGGPSHGYDDHRSQHEDELERRFARRVLEKTRRVAEANKARCVVLVAPARMLGLLRQHLVIIRKRGMEVHGLAKDMTKFSPKQIHDYLAREQLLPACKRPRT
jgi:protein required for attachment to host cells